MEKQVFNQRIRDFDFTRLFNELGWNYLNEARSIKIEEETFNYHSIAQKEGFRIIVCQASENGKIPSYSIRRKVQTEISKNYHESLLIFIDKNRSEQTWQMIDRQPNKPNQFRQTNWKSHQDPELLYQRMKGAFFTLSEEEGLTIVDVTHRLRQNFTANAEKVTKQFYDKFKNEHKRFLGFIEGITVMGDREWYASLMLNRLMFCYFIQKKGFLNDDINYLRNKLKETRDKQGKDRFYSFYKSFLLILFHKGLGSPHTDSLLPDLGRVPYLNGGLFDVHELEKSYTNIEVKDEAFEKIFNFFDEYNWHLDDSPTATGRDINPDVIGYIFEKYINDRAQMGAYYTREDITDYISKNCIIPYLFDEVKRKYPAAMKEGAETWNMLKESGDKYIYGAVKHGLPKNGDLFDDLPSEVKVGFNEDLGKKIVEDTTSPHLYELRREWNQPAPAKIALPTEIYREVIERRNRYQVVKGKIETGKVKEINDFITYNLDIKQFTQDVLENTTDPALVHHFYEALKGVTILDPTCGSGAFLFAAMNILETLYRKCIDRMESFVEDEGGTKYSVFVRELEQVNRPEHPNLDCFIYKSIILNNLYGVDIMNEAVEIAKLRLFLKLMATVDPDYKKDNLGLEPLPDVDFNIRCGNTLVGFATGDELKKGLDYTFDGAIVRPQIEEKCEVVAKAFKRYKEIQLNQGDDYEGFKEAKEEHNKRLKELNKQLNELLHMQYSGTKYEEWLKSYQPFHWFAEYYEIIEENKGFAVIIGNPPYVEYSEVNKTYELKDYKTIECGNLHAYCLERSLSLKKAEGYLGFILPLALISTPRMESAIKMLKSSCDSYFSSFECRPAKLFEGADIRLSIIILKKKAEQKSNFKSTRLIKFLTSQRNSLFQSLYYTDLRLITQPYNLIPKTSNSTELDIYNKLFTVKKRISSFISDSVTNFKLFYSYGFRYWAKVLITPTYFEGENAQKSTGEKELCILQGKNRTLIGSAMSSSLFYWYYVVTSDAHNFTKHIIYNFPINELTDSKLDDVFYLYQEDLEVNSILKTASYKSTGTINYREYYVKKSKPIIDQIDQLLAVHYGFTEEELDFIINYDIKYRMGIGSGEEIEE
ncbi:MAG: Eco57I restriction-modification methylase domain-containing protein [Bacteroidales bacterium]|nr:Eco57I restriction-modification methylase domain-containing protein [Bacteroidales bacterium]